MQEKIDSLSLSCDADHSAFASWGAGPEEIPSPPQFVILEERFWQPDANTALAASHLSVKSSVSTAEENLRHVSAAPKMFLTHEKAYPDASTNESATLETSTGLISSSPKADTEPEGQDQTCPPVACIDSVSTVEPTGSMLSQNANEVS